MRLLLDENLNKAIAEQLRSRGVDTAVTEDPPSRGRSDGDLFDRAAQERRAFVTYDIDDLRVISNDRMTAELDHHGLILLSGKRFPQGAQSIGAIVEALERLCRDMPEENALAGREFWL